MQAENRSRAVNIGRQAAEVKNLKTERDGIVKVVFEQDRGNEPNRSTSMKQISMAASICDISVWPVRC